MHRALHTPSNEEIFITWTLADPHILAGVESITLAIEYSHCSSELWGASWHGSGTLQGCAPALTRVVSGTSHWTETLAPPNSCWRDYMLELAWVQQGIHRRILGWVVWADFLWLSLAHMPPPPPHSTVPILIVRILISEYAWCKLHALDNTWFSHFHLICPWDQEI